MWNSLHEVHRDLKIWQSLLNQNPIEHNGTQLTTEFNYGIDISVVFYECGKRLNFKFSVDLISRKLFLDVSYDPFYSNQTCTSKNKYMRDEEPSEFERYSYPATPFQQKIFSSFMTWLDTCGIDIMIQSSSNADFQTPFHSHLLNGVALYATGLKSNQVIEWLKRLQIKGVHCYDTASFELIDAIYHESTIQVDWVLSHIPEIHLIFSPDNEDSGSYYLIARIQSENDLFHFLNEIKQKKDENNLLLIETEKQIQSLYPAIKTSLDACKLTVSNLYDFYIFPALHEYQDQYIVYGPGVTRFVPTKNQAAETLLTDLHEMLLIQQTQQNLFSFIEDKTKEKSEIEFDSDFLTYVSIYNQSKELYLGYDYSEVAFDDEIISYYFQFENEKRISGRNLIQLETQAKEIIFEYISARRLNELFLQETR
jgi:hypothetical protein